LDIFQAVFGNLTGEDARPTLWRGRPRPRKDREAVKAGQQIVDPPTGAEAEAPAYYQGVPPDFAKASSGRPGRYV